MKPFKHTVLKYSLYIFLLLLLIEILFAVYRNILRYVVYKKALKRAKVLNKKLLVIGDPDAGVLNKIFGRVYNCGDMCLDLNGCACKNTIHFNLNNLNQLPLNLKDYVVYESCVFEFTDEPEKIMKAIQQETELYQVRINPSIIYNIKPFFEFRQNGFYNLHKQ